MSQKESPDLLSEWQQVMHQWDQVSRSRAEAAARCERTDLSAEDREHWERELAELALQATVLQQEIDAIVRAGSKGRTGSGNEFTGATLSSNQEPADFIPPPDLRRLPR